MSVELTTTLATIGPGAGWDGIELIERITFVTGNQLSCRVIGHAAIPYYAVLRLITAVKDLRFQRISHH